MTAATNVKILAESYYSKLWIGDGTVPAKLKDPVAKDANGDPLEVTPQLGWCYVDATTGDFYIYDGSAWNDSGAQWSGAFL